MPMLKLVKLVCLECKTALKYNSDVPFALECPKCKVLYDIDLGG